MILSKILKSDWFCLGTCICLPQLSRLFCVLTRSADYLEWYKGIKKPRYTPPDWVFPITWSTLYVGMGFSSYIIVKEYIRRGSSEECFNSLLLYGFNLALNLYWPYAFFGKHNVGEAFAVTCVLAFTASLCSAKFFLIDTTAGWLLMPYVAWSSFAMVLGYECWIKN